MNYRTFFALKVSNEELAISIDFEQKLLFSPDKWVTCRTFGYFTALKYFGFMLLTRSDHEK